MKAQPWKIETPNELATPNDFTASHISSAVRQFFNMGMVVTHQGRGERPAHLPLHGVLVGGVLQTPYFCQWS